jgi:hypothetical protein
MAVTSVFAEAGFATGAGVSGAFAVVGCGVSGFLLPHMVLTSTANGTCEIAGAGPGCETLYIRAQKCNKEITGVVFQKVTQAGGPAGKSKLKENGVVRNGKSLSM